MDEMDLLLEGFEKNPENLDVQIKILNLARGISNSTELVQKIMKGCRSKVSKKGGFFVVGISNDSGSGKKEKSEAQLDSSPAPLGKLHSEHLYLAAKCIGCSPLVDDKVLEDITNHLLSEFDLEVTFPQAAINAFSHIGE